MAKTYLQSKLEYKHTKFLVMVGTLLHHNICWQGYAAAATCSRDIPVIAAQLCCFVKLHREVRRHLPAEVWASALQHTKHLMLRLVSTTEVAIDLCSTCAYQFPYASSLQACRKAERSYCVESGSVDVYQVPARVRSQHRSAATACMQ